MAGGLGDAPTPAGDVCEYASKNGTFQRTWPLAVPRYLHGHLPLGAGRHLLLGGLTASPGDAPTEVLTASPGDDTPPPGGLEATAAVELLDLRTGTSERLPDLPFKTLEPLVAALPGGRILVAGGYDDVDSLAHTALLDMASRTWQTARPLPSPRCGCAVVRLGARHLLFAGGWSDVGVPAREEALILDLVTLNVEVALLPTPSEAAFVDLGDSRFLVIGGRTPDGAPLLTVTLWTATPSP